jgi:hypothetical protein
VLLCERQNNEIDEINIEIGLRFSCFLIHVHEHNLLLLICIRIPNFFFIQIRIPNLLPQYIGKQKNPTYFSLGRSRAVDMNHYLKEQFE